MNILDPTLTINSLYILPRDYQNIASVQIVFTNEVTNEETVLEPVDIYNDSNNLQLDIEFLFLKEGERYSFVVQQYALLDYDSVNKIWSTPDIPLDTPTYVDVFRGQALVTSFESENYTINKDEFVIDNNTDSDEKPVYNG